MGKWLENHRKYLGKIWEFPLYMEVSSWESHLEMVEFPARHVWFPETSSSLNRTLPKGLGFLWTAPGCQEQVVVDLSQDPCRAIMPLISSYEDSVMTCQFLTKWRQKQKCCDILMLSATILWDFKKGQQKHHKNHGFPCNFPLFRAEELFLSSAAGSCNLLCFGHLWSSHHG